MQIKYLQQNNKGAFSYSTPYIKVIVGITD